MPIESYRDLRVFQKSVELARESYRLALTFPDYERFGMVSQLRRAAVSVLANIAEGHGRTHRAEYAHHLSIARGSVREIEALLLFAEEMRYRPEDEFARARELCDAVSRMLIQLQRALRR